MSDDHSPGDARKPYSDRGGPEGRHAETHDVRREQVSNPAGPEPVDESFAEDLAPQTPESIRQDQIEMTVPGDRVKAVRTTLPELDNAQLSRLAVLETGTPFEQGSVYLDLNDREAGPFVAIGGQQVERQQRLVPKRDTDYELWNEITGQERSA
ncbi:MAG: hypothetical protein QM589_01235 [Thermomicrobiales bacterium]